MLGGPDIFNAKNRGQSVLKKIGPVKLASQPLPGFPLPCQAKTH